MYRTRISSSRYKCFTVSQSQCQSGTYFISTMCENKDTVIIKARSECHAFSSTCQTYSFIHSFIHLLSSKSYELMPNKWKNVHNMNIYNVYSDRGYCKYPKHDIDHCYVYLSTKWAVFQLYDVRSVHRLDKDSTNGSRNVDKKINTYYWLKDQRSKTIYRELFIPISWTQKQLRRICWTQVES